MPLLPLRGLTIFPNMLLNFDVGREKSIKALEYAMHENQLIFLVAQRDIRTDTPEENDLYQNGHRLACASAFTSSGRQHQGAG